MLTTLHVTPAELRRDIHKLIQGAELKLELARSRLGRAILDGHYKGCDAAIPPARDVVISAETELKELQAVQLAIGDFVFDLEAASQTRHAVETAGRTESNRAAFNEALSEFQAGYKSIERQGGEALVSAVNSLAAIARKAHATAELRKVLRENSRYAKVSNRV
jgi:hypothetical protein